MKHHSMVIFLKYMREDVEAIKPYLPDSKLDDELYKIKRKFDNQLKKRQPGHY